MGKATFLFALTIPLALLAATAAAQQPKKAVIQSGQAVRLSCTDLQNNKRWLSGTDEGIKLVKKADDPGTLWQVFFENNIVLIRNVSNVKDVRWLDGLTVTGGLRFVERPEPTGCRWEFTQFKDGRYEIRCLGHIDGFRWLHADISKNEVRLAKKSETPIVMRWEVEAVKDRK